MGIKAYESPAKEKARVTFNLPNVSGNYANERITFGRVGGQGVAAAAEGISGGQREQSFSGFTATAETLVTGAAVELWLAQNEDDVTKHSAFTDANYYNSGLTPLLAQGTINWSLIAGCSGAQIRVKSGGTVGPMAISATAV